MCLCHVEFSAYISSLVIIIELQLLLIFTGLLLGS